MIAVVDYGMGNLASVCNALYMLGADVERVSDPRVVDEAEKVVLPGVGAFGDCMVALRSSGLAEALDRAALQDRRPVLGICLGMQVMASWGHEGGRHQGLGWFDAEVVRLTPDDPALRVPHVGWNDVSVDSRCPLLDGLPPAPDFYFVHSFAMRCNDPGDVVGTCDYGGTVTAAVARDNIFATQFHPEKSQDYGLRILENFLDWTP